MPLPRTFLAYPSESHVADSMKRLIGELRAAGSDIVDWKDIRNPGFLIRPILESIDNAPLFLAESTFGNPNVLFELGYAIAKGKTTYQMMDNNAARPRNLPVLEPVRHIEYSKRQDVIDFLEAADLSAEPLSEQLGISFPDEARGRLYFIPSRYEPDVNQAIWNLCDQSPFDCATIDKSDSDYDSLQSQARSISEADVFVTVLISENGKEYWDVNAQLMLLAGLAKGMDKSIVVLVQQPLRRLLDLGDSALPFVTETDAEFTFARQLKFLTSERLKAPQPKRSVVPARKSPLTGLFFGSLDARADFDLADYFIETPEFHQAEAGQRHLFVGSKGSGKTANFERLQERFEGRNNVVVSIAPADFEFPRLAAVFDQHLDLARWEFVYGSFWRFILITEIMRAVRDKFYDHLLRESSQHFASHLLDWLKESEELLNLDFVSRVTEVLSRIPMEEEGEEKRAKLEDLLQVARLYEIEGDIKRFAADFEIRMFIDDLDRNWSPIHDAANRLIVALLNEVQAVMDALRPHLKVAIFVRKDVFDWLVEQDQEILKRDPAVLRWDAESLETMIASRIAKHLETPNREPSELWAMVFPERVRGERTQEFLTTRTLLRPRDVIQFCQKATETAQRAGRVAVSEDDVYDAWEATGELLFAQAETEYAARFPRLGEVALGLIEAPALMGIQDALSRLASATAPMQERPAWLRNAAGEPIRIIEVLYETGIVGIRTARGSTYYVHDRPLRDVYGIGSPQEAGLLARVKRLLKLNNHDDGQRIVIHPAFRRYLRSTERDGMNNVLSEC